MAYYFICFAVTWILTVIYFIKWKSTFNTFITLSFIDVAINNFGYWQLAMAENIREAVMAQYLAYTGSAFMTVLILFSIFDICNIHIKKIYRIALFAIDFFVFVCSLTIGHSQIFYKSVSITKRDGFTVLVKEYGPMHTVYYISLVLYFLIAIATLIYALKKKSEISKRNAILLLLCFFVCILSFVMGRVLGTYDLITASTNLVLFTYIIISDRFVLYDVDATAMQTLQKSNSVGIITFDLRNRFLGCNRVASEYFPELEKLKIDYVTTDPLFLEWISEMGKSGEFKKTISRQGRFFSLEGRYLKSGTKIRSIQFILLDCTVEMEYQEYLKKVAVTDDMTHLFNRRAFENEAQKYLEQAMPDNFVVISFDLNGLKKVNDTIGHHAGDELICAAAAKISEAISPIGTVYRIGGDEFEAIAFCEPERLNQILTALVQSCAAWKGEYSTLLSLSKGFAFHAENPSMDIFELVRVADKQMYSDKSQFYRSSGHDRRRRD